MEIINKKPKYQTVITMWLILSFGLALVFLYNANSGFSDVFRSGSPDGQFLYLVSKALGLTALFLLWWQLMSALLSSYGFFDKAMLSILKAGKTTHIVFGSMLAIFVISHAGLFISAVSLRQDLFAIHLLVPDFTGYYHVGLSLGVIALFVILAAVTLAASRKYFQRLWVYGHKLVLPGFGLAALHAVLIGSEAGSGKLMYLIIFFVFSIVVAALVYYARRSNLKSDT